MVESRKKGPRKTVSWNKSPSPLLAFGPDQRAPPSGPLLISDHVRLVQKKIVGEEGKAPFYPLPVDLEMTIFIRFDLKKKNKT